MSSFGRQLEKKDSTRLKIPPRVPQLKSENKPQQALNDWIVKSRAGNATNTALRGRRAISVLD